MNRFAPRPSPPQNIKFPEIKAGVLENGIQVLCVHDPYLPKVSIRAVFSMGRVHDPEVCIGRLQLTSDMLKEGTARYSSQSLADYLDRMALDLDFEVATEHSFVSITGMKDHVEAAVELLAEILQNPSFPEDELEKVKVRWKGLLISQRSDPGFLANERILYEIFGNHPYSRATISLEQLQAIQRSDLENGLAQIWGAGCFLVFTGAVTIEDALRLADSQFGKLHPETTPSSSDIPLPERKRSAVLVCRPHSTQTRVAIGIRTIPRSDERFLTFRLANQVFGGGASSRLFLNLREDKGYTYGAYSAVRSHHQSGLLVAAASVNTESAIFSIEEILKEAELMSRQYPSEEELERSKAELAGAFIRRTETPTSVGSLEISRRLLGLPEDYYHTYIPQLQGLTGADVTKVSEDLLVASQMVIVAVSDRESLEKELHNFGELKVFDAEGNRLE